MDGFLEYMHFRLQKYEIHLLGIISSPNFNSGGGG